MTTPTSFRLTENCLNMIGSFSESLGIQRSAVVEIALRELAKKQRFGNTPLMQRLKEIMPSKPKQTLSGDMMRLEVHPIRMSADSFFHWLNNELPATEEEMLAVLWTFGELLCGQMETQLNLMMKSQGDLLATLPIQTTVLAQVEAKQKAYEDAVSLRSGKVPPMPNK